MAVRRTRQLKPLSSEHHQALLIAFQLKQGIAGHPESAGAPRDLPGLVALARRFHTSILSTHTKAEEELLGRFLVEKDIRRLTSEHAELSRLLDVAGGGRGSDARSALSAFADLLEKHVRWEERELFGACEKEMGEEALAIVGGELEKRLVLAHSEGRTTRRA